MDHGVTASVGYKMAREASVVKRRSVALIESNRAMIHNYEAELLEYKKRLAVMEKAEMTRIAKEQAIVEFKATHSGKDPNYFKVPKLTTANRKNVQKKLTMTKTLSLIKD